MRLATSDGHLGKTISFSRADRVERGRFAHNRILGTYYPLIDKIARTYATYLLIGCEDDAQWLTQSAQIYLGSRRQNAGKIPLHIARAASLEIVAILDQSRSVRPIAAVGNSVGMADKHQMEGSAVWGRFTGPRN